MMTGLCQVLVGRYGRYGSCFILDLQVKELLKRIASDTTGGLVEDEKPLMESGALSDRVNFQGVAADESNDGRFRRSLGCTTYLLTTVDFSQ